LNTLEQLRSGELAGSRRLKLACGLTAFPREIFDLAETLEILDLSGNALSSLPDDLPRLHKLRILFCSDNQFTELPAVLGQCPAQHDRFQGQPDSDGAGGGATAGPALADSDR
jgi:Leucine-rich repeat (LRR) protein